MVNVAGPPYRHLGICFYLAPVPNEAVCTTFQLCCRHTPPHERPRGQQREARPPSYEIPLPAPRGMFVITWHNCEKLCETSLT